MPSLVVTSKDLEDAHSNAVVVVHVVEPVRIACHGFGRGDAVYVGCSPISGPNPNHSKE